MSVQARDRAAEIVPRRVPYREWGDPDAPALILLHGLLGNRCEWDTVAQDLATRRRVIVPDQRGHGTADWGRDYTATRLVSDLSDLVDALGLSTLDLVGHSMGGIVSMLYASVHTERVRSVVLIDIGPDSLADQGNRNGFLQLLATMRQARYDGPEVAVTEWLAGDPLALRVETTRWAEHALRREPDGRWAWRVDLDGIGEFLTKPPTPEQLWSAVDHIHAPALVIHGQHSWALPAGAAQTLAARLPDASAVQIDGAGHDLGVQAPHRVAAQIAAFLDQQPRTPVHAKARLGEDHDHA